MSPVEALESRALFAAAAPAGLDLSFGGGDGVLDVPLGLNATISDAVVAPDGKVVVVGYTKPIVMLSSGTRADPDRDAFIGRFNPDGTPDTTFGPAGTGFVVRHFFNTGREIHALINDEASSVALMPDGKIVVGGTNGVLVYNADGTPYDPTGASEKPGAVEMWGSYPGSHALLDWVIDVAPAPADGPGGAFYAAGEWIETFLVRRTPEGTIDRPFGESNPGPPASGGTLVTRSDYDEGVNTILAAPDGRVIIAGWRTSYPGQGAGARTVQGMHLMRYDASGAFDPSFANRQKFAPGTFLPAKGVGGGALALTTQPDGKLVAVGTAVKGEGRIRSTAGPAWSAKSSVVWVARFNPDGTEDLSFGRKGSAYVRVGRIGKGTDVKVLPDGRIFVAALTAANQRDAYENVYGYAAVRLTPDGRPDPTFGGGRVPGTRVRVPPGVLPLPVAPPADRWGDDFGLQAESPERALLVTDAAGHVHVLSASNGALHVARLLTDGES